MKSIILYTDLVAVNLDLEALDTAKKQLLSISEFLVSKGIEPNGTNIKNATLKSFAAVAKDYAAAETEKIQKIIDQFGDTALTDGWEQKVNDKAARHLTELIKKVPVFDHTEHLQYFTFENGIEVKKEFDKQYFADKNSIILSDPEKIERYEKHCKCCELLNELMGHPDNEFTALDKLFYFNADTKEFEMSIYPHDYSKHAIDAAKEAKELQDQARRDEIYNNSCKRAGEIAAEEQKGIFRWGSGSISGVH